MSYTYVCIDTQLISFQNCFSLLPEKWLKDVFSLPIIPRTKEQSVADMFSARYALSGSGLGTAGCRHSQSRRESHYGRLAVQQTGQQGSARRVLVSTATCRIILFRITYVSTSLKFSCDLHRFTAAQDNVDVPLQAVSR
jgi:hypothetical protein